MILRDLRESSLLSEIWNNKWKMVGLWIATVLLVAGVLIFWPRTYKSEARIFLQVGRESVGLDPTATTGQTIAVQQSDRSDEIITAIDILRSRGIVEKAVRRLTPDVITGKTSMGGESSEPNPISEIVSGLIGGAVEIVRSLDPVTEDERAIIKVQKNLEIAAERNSEIISIHYHAKSPQLAQLIVDTVVEIYQEEHARVHRTLGSKKFFEEQRGLLKVKVADKITELQQMKNEFGFATVEGKRTLLERQLGDVVSDKYQTEKLLEESRSKILDIKRQIDVTSQRLPSVELTKDSEAANLQSQQLFAVQLREIELSTRFSDNHPALKIAREQAKEAALKHQANNTASKEVSNDINPIYQQLVSDKTREQTLASGYEARLAMLIDQEKKILESVRELNHQEIKIKEIEREYQLAEQDYMTYSKNLEQIRVDNALESDRISSVNVVQQASLQHKPASPSKLLVIAFGGLLGLTGTAWLIFGRIFAPVQYSGLPQSAKPELRDESFEEEEQFASSVH